MRRLPEQGKRGESNHDEKEPLSTLPRKRQRYADRGLIGYLIRIEASLIDEEVTAIWNKQTQRQFKMIANIGKVTVDNVDVGHAYKDFFRLW